MKKILTCSILSLSLFTTTVLAQPLSYVVKAGDTLWKIAVANETGVSELVSLNPQIKNPALIYPGQKVAVPNIQDIKAFENEVIKLVNAERSKRGLQILKANWELCRVARYKSQDMVNKNYFSHTSPTYGSPFKMMETFGIRFSAGGENIASGQRTASEVMVSWMNSPGHRSNILSPSFTEIGVGLAKTSTGKTYWTQMFIKTMY